MSQQTCPSLPSSCPCPPLLPLMDVLGDLCGFPPPTQASGPSQPCTPKSCSCGLASSSIPFRMRSSSDSCSELQMELCKYKVEPRSVLGAGKGICWVRKCTSTEPFPTTPPLPPPQTARIINCSLHWHLHISQKPREPEQTAATAKMKWEQHAHKKNKEKKKKGGFGKSQRVLQWEPSCLLATNPWFKAEETQPSPAPEQEGAQELHQEPVQPHLCSSPLPWCRRTLPFPSSGYWGPTAPHPPLQSLWGIQKNFGSAFFWVDKIQLHLGKRNKKKNPTTNRRM